MKGYIDDYGRIANFHCMLPTAEDVFENGVPEECHRTVEPTAKGVWSSLGGDSDEQFTRQSRTVFDQTEEAKKQREMEEDEDFNPETGEYEDDSEVKQSKIS